MAIRAKQLLPIFLAIVAASGASGPAWTGGEVMTPDQAVEGRRVGYVTVEFRVGRVGMLTGEQGDGMPPHLSPCHLVAESPLAGGGKFHVYLNGKLLEDLNRLAIEPAGHFRGAQVRVTGTVCEATAQGVGAGRDHQMVVLDLDKIRVVERPGR